MLKIVITKSDDVTSTVDEVVYKVEKKVKMKWRSQVSFLYHTLKRAFSRLREAFIPIPILYHFDSKYYIRIEIDTFGYVIGRVLSQLTPDQ